MSINGENYSIGTISHFHGEDSTRYLGLNSPKAQLVKTLFWSSGA